MDKFTNGLKKLDWASIGVFGLSIAASVAKLVYNNKRFDDHLNKQYDGHLDDKVSKIVDTKLKKKGL